MARSLLSAHGMEIAIPGKGLREGVQEPAASATPASPTGLTAREAINGAALAAMIASYLVVGFLASS